MFETAVSWFKDSTVQGLFLSPLIGAIMGLLLTFLTQGSQLSNANRPRDVILIVQKKITNNNPARNNSDDPAAVLIALAAALLFSIYFYAVHSVLIIDTAFKATLFAISLGVAFVFALILQSRISGAEWIARVVLPLVFILFSWALWGYAQRGIVPGAKEVAEQSGVVKFYFSALDEPHRNWILSQLLGVLASAVYTILAIVNLFHNMALLQVRYQGQLQAFWLWVFRATHFFSTGGVVFLIILLGALALCLLNGMGYEFLMSRVKL